MVDTILPHQNNLQPLFANVQIHLSKTKQFVQVQQTRLVNISGNQILPSSKGLYLHDNEGNRSFFPNNREIKSD